MLSFVVGSDRHQESHEWLSGKCPVVWRRSGERSEPGLFRLSSLLATER